MQPSRGCFGCCTKPPTVISVEDRSKGLKIQGFIVWNQIRQQWIGIRESQNRVPVERPKLSFEATYENLLGTNKRFPRPIPLSEMVDFLVDVWEQEGLYD
nr:uncharacterized protein LOC109150330 [Ipomoea batatas]GMD88170.1 uncharacterized protein LOC109150330 [Ipomoea batatas]